MFKHISCVDDFNILFQNCQNILDGSEQWLMKLNIKKCKILSIGRNVNKEFKYGFNVPDVGFREIDRVETMQDLGVMFEEDLSFQQHINDKVNKAFQMIGIINRNFKHLHKSSFILLYKCLVRSHLEYANTVWNSFRASLIDVIEKVQKRATKIVRGCRNKNYTERLMSLNLPTMKYRRLRGDMIEVYKILNGKYDSKIVPCLKLSSNVYTRGNSLKLSVERAKYDLRKYSFPVRTVNYWNSLPDYVIKSESVNSFKNSLDNLWKKEEMYFNYRASFVGNHPI
jgi:hypothetical protein